MFQRELRPGANAQIKVMEYLIQNPGAGSGQISAATGRALNQNACTLRRLRDNGFICRSGNRYYYQYRLTALGREELKRISGNSNICPTVYSTMGLEHQPSKQEEYIMTTPTTEYIEQLQTDVEAKIVFAKAQLTELEATQTETEEQIALARTQQTQLEKLQAAVVKLTAEGDAPVRVASAGRARRDQEREAQVAAPRRGAPKGQVRRPKGDRWEKTLALIVDKGEVVSREAADSLSIPRAQGSTLMTNLERKGLISHSTHSGINYYRITESGREWLGEFRSKN